MIKSIKPKKCRICKELFTPKRAIQPCCDNFECKVQYGIAAAEKSAITRKKKEARQHKEKLEAIKPKADYMKEAQRAFNLYVRTRDAKELCICCNRTSNMDTGVYGHAWDCGHYRSVGSAPHLRFNENNAHKQLVVCNRYGSGRAVDYRIGLIAKIGLAEVEKIEADQSPKNYTIDDLKAIKVKYKQMTKELKEKQA